MRFWKHLDGFGEATLLGLLAAPEVLLVALGTRSWGFWGSVELILAALGGFLGALGALLVAPEVLLVAFECPLGARGMILGALGPPLGPGSSWPLLGLWGVCWSDSSALEGFREVLGYSWGALGRP